MLGVEVHADSWICLGTVTGRNNKNPQTETLRKQVTPSRKQDGLHMFTLADASRLLMFPSLRLQRNRTTFLHVSVGFPLEETSVSTSVIL